MKNLSFLAGVLLLTVPGPIFGQSEEPEYAGLLAEPDALEIEAYLVDRAESDGYQQIKIEFLNQAKDLVLSNEYSQALEILEALLSVDLDNLEVQEIYIAVGKIVKEEETARTAVAETEGAAAEEEPGKEPDVGAAGGETLTAEQIAETVARAVAEAMAQDGGSRTDPAQRDEAAEHAETTQAAQSTGSGTETASVDRDIRTAEGELSRKPATGPGIVLGDYIDWSLHLGVADLLLYGSQFYTDFYNDSQVFLSYGLSLDLEAIVTLEKLNLSGEVNFDTFFGDLVPLSGTEISYKLMLGAALPRLISIPLYARLGFGQFWYLFGDETPNKLITAVPSPFLGIKLNGLRLGSLFSIDGSIDYYIITFFTSYIATAFDISAALEIALPIRSSLAFSVRVEVQPTVVIGSGGAETSGKLKISFGVGNDEIE